MKGSILAVFLAASMIGLSIAGSAVRDRLKVWKNASVFYEIDPSVSEDTRKAIRYAIRAYERDTCVSFTETSYISARVRFTENVSRCYKTRVGYNPSVQEVVISPSCHGGIDLKAQALHEIGHVLGLYNEFNRPDRSTYVKVLKKNALQNGSSQAQFKKDLDWSRVHKQGVQFDYTSVMQYGTHFLSRNGKETVKNLRIVPRIKIRNVLSSLDALTVNRLYHCPVERNRGKLTLKLRKTKSLPTRGFHLIVEAVKSDGKSVIKDIRVEEPRNGPPLSDYSVDVGNDEWQFMRVKVLDLERSGTIILEQLIPFHGFVELQIHELCKNPTECSKMLEFEYSLLPNSHDACENGNPCLNGGTCVDLPGDNGYTCSCAGGFSGTNCQKYYGNLSISVWKGEDLDDRDPVWNASDPYVHVRAYRYDGTSVEKWTDERRGTHNPLWNDGNSDDYLLSFGPGEWNKYEVTVMDSDDNEDDVLISTQTFFLTRPTVPSDGFTTKMICKDRSANCSTNRVLFHERYYITSKGQFIFSVAR